MMNPRMPKRNICRYFASGGSCFYGDSCQFQHVRGEPPSVRGPIASTRPINPNPNAAGIPVTSISAGGGSGAMVGSSGNPAPLRSQSANTALRHPGASNAGVRLTMPPLERHRRPDHQPFSGRSAPQRPTSYRSSLSHRASNPPKHRMGGAVSRTTNTKGVSGHTQSQHSHSGALSSPPRKGNQETSPRGLMGGGSVQNMGGGVGITALQPPPVSKQAKIRATSSNTAQSLVQSGGTTYFYSGQQPSFAPDYTVYTKPPSHMTRKTAFPPGFFVSEDLRQELHQQQVACLTLPTAEDSCPKEVDSYHTLCPLEPVDTTKPDQEAKRTFGHPSTCYRALSQKDGLYYCLRRIHGFRLTSAKAVQELDKWKKLEHVNVVSLREMFTTKAFGDHSVVFVSDYHPAAQTLREKYLRSSKRMSPLPEDLVWDYLIQLASALRLVHGSHLALRCLDPSKVLLTSRRRLRINCAGIVDILTFDASATALSPSIHQQGDLFSLGQLLLCVGLQSMEAGRPDNLHRSMEMVANTYSPDLGRLLQYLLQSASKGSHHSILEVMSMLGGRVHLSLERALQREDLLEMELSKEVQNGRLFKILAKLGTINERSEFAGDEQWSETGDRYLLKLLRDYLFHQVLPSGAPWINLAHIVQTLNKLDAGTYENVALHSRDEQAVLVVSYADLKECLDKTFGEIFTSSTTSSSSGHVPLDSNGHRLNGSTHSTTYGYGGSKP